jgi:putative spermidine/putrescine transport system permease protein
MSAEASPWRIAWMLAPTLVVLGLLFVGGVVVGVAQSLGYMPVIGLVRPTFAAYRDLVVDPEFWAALALTLYLALTSTLLATVLAVASALVLRRSSRGAQAVTFVYQLPLPAPHLVAAAGITMLLTQSGLAARVLYAFGALDQPAEFPALVFDRAHIGVLAVYTWKEVPFIGLVILAVLKGVGHDYDEAARTLGASAWQRLRYVLLPLLLPGIVTTSIIVFAFLFGSFEIPLLLGQRYPSALPVLAYRAYSDPDLARRPEAMAIGVVITGVVLGLMVVYRRLARRG